MLLAWGLHWKNLVSGPQLSPNCWQHISALEILLSNQLWRDGVCCGAAQSTFSIPEETCLGNEMSCGGGKEAVRACVRCRWRFLVSIYHVFSNLYTSNTFFSVSIYFVNPLFHHIQLNLYSLSSLSASCQGFQWYPFHWILFHQCSLYI